MWIITWNGIEGFAHSFRLAGINILHPDIYIKIISGNQTWNCWGITRLLDDSPIETFQFGGALPATLEALRAWRYGHLCVAVLGRFQVCQGSAETKPSEVGEIWKTAVEIEDLSIEHGGSLHIVARFLCHVVLTFTRGYPYKTGGFNHAVFMASWHGVWVRWFAGWWLTHHDSPILPHVNIINYINRYNHTLYIYNIYIHTYTYIFMYIMCMYIYIYMYIFIHIISFPIILSYFGSDFLQSSHLPGTTKTHRPDSFQRVQGTVYQQLFCLSLNIIPVNVHAIRNILEGYSLT